MIGKRRLRAWVLSAAVLGTPGWAQTMPDEALERAFPYVASEAAVSRVAAEIMRRTGVGVRVDESVAGEVTVQLPDGTLRELMDDVAGQIGAIWWHDGSILRIERMAEFDTRLVDPGGLSVEEIEREMAAMGFLDERFPLRMTSDGMVLRVAGPAGYVSEVIAFVEVLRRVRVARAGLGGGGAEGAEASAVYYLPRVYHGRSI